MILTKVPGLQTDAALQDPARSSLSDLSAYTRRDAPVLVLDAATGKRWPIWAELDANATQGRTGCWRSTRRRNFLEGHRYVVVLRGLRRADGAAHQGRPALRQRCATRKGVAPAPRYDAHLQDAEEGRDPARQGAVPGLGLHGRQRAQRSRGAHAARSATTRSTQLGDTNLADGVVQGTAPPFTLTNVAERRRREVHRAAARRCSRARSRCPAT